MKRSKAWFDSTKSLCCLTTPFARAVTVSSTNAVTVVVLEVSRLNGMSASCSGVTRNLQPMPAGFDGTVTHKFRIPNVRTLSGQGTPARRPGNLGSDRALVIDGWRAARRQAFAGGVHTSRHGWAALHGRATRDYHHRFGPSRRHFCKLGVGGAYRGFPDAVACSDVGEAAGCQVRSLADHPLDSGRDRRGARANRPTPSSLGSRHSAARQRRTAGRPERGNHTPPQQFAGRAEREPGLRWRVHTRSAGSRHPLAQVRRLERESRRAGSRGSVPCALTPAHRSRNGKRCPAAVST